MKFLQRPIQHIYPFETHCSSSTSEIDNAPPADDDKQESDCEGHSPNDASHVRPIHGAATQAQLVIGLLGVCLKISVEQSLLNRV